MVATVSPRHKFGANGRHSHAVLLTGTELAKREAQWLQKHDQATNGIMGFFPASLNEPVRFTATQSKQLRIFKNTRGVLVHWELHAA